MIDEITPTLQPGNGSTRVMALRSAWEKGEFCDLADPLLAAATPKQAADLVISEQFYRWKHGDRRRIETYVQSYPSLRSDSKTLLEMLRAEVLLRREYKESPQIGEYESSFPEISGQLHQMLDSASGSPDMEATLGVAEADLWRPRGKSLAADAPQITGYELLEELGRGGMGVVFRAKQLLADREVALKIIRPDSLALLDPSSREGVIRRFGAEARAAAKLNNDHIVTVYDIGECRGFHYYTMKLVEGPSLSSLIREKPLDDRLAARYCMEASLGVHAAHELGILHRDLKPSNVMLDRVTGRALVADFGLAKIVDEGREQLTHSGDVVGTPAYMPPEQAKDSSTVTAQSDVYSMGATLYHSITGRPPFQAASLGEILRQIADEEPIPPRRMNPRISRDLETICLKAMQKAPAQRYATAKDFADELHRFLEGRPILARPVSRIEAMRRWCVRNPHLSGAIGIATSLAVATVLAIIIAYIQTSVAFNETKIALGNSKRRLEKSLSLVDELFTKVSEDDLLNEPGMQAVRKQLLAKAKAHYEELLADSADLPFAKEELAAAHYRFGKISLELGNTDDARRELAEAEREQRNQLAEKQDDKERMLSLANTLTEVAKVRQTDQEFENLSAVRREVLDLRLQVLAKSASNNEVRRLAASARMNLGIALREEGQLAQALKELELAQVEREAILSGDQTQHKTRRDFAQGAFHLALLYLKFNAKDGNTDSMKNALKQFDIAIDNFEKLSQLQPRILSHRLNLAQTFRTKATHEPTPDSDYARADQVNQRLMDENPDVVDYRIEAGQLKLERGVYFASVSKWEEAVSSYRECEATLKDLAKKDANAIDFLATCLVRQSEAELALGKTKEAINSAERSKGWWEVLTKQTPSDAYLKENLDQVNAMLAKLYANVDSNRKSQP